MTLKQGDFVYYDNAVVKISGGKGSTMYIYNNCIYIVLPLPPLILTTALS